MGRRCRDTGGADPAGADKGTQVLAAPEPRLAASALVAMPDLADVKGQETARRALEIAAAGGHNLLNAAPPATASSDVGNVPCAADHR